jgi:L-rhamnose mutarotase
MVMHKGNISLFDEELFSQLKDIGVHNYSRIYVNGACKYIWGKLPELMQKIWQHYPEASFPVTC